MNETQDPELLNFCRNIRWLRQRHHLSKTKMAAALGTSTKTISALENDILPPRLNSIVLFNLTWHFHIPPHLLFCSIEEWPELYIR